MRFSVLPTDTIAQNTKDTTTKMKLALATTLIASAAAFAPSQQVRLYFVSKVVDESLAIMRFVRSSCRGMHVKMARSESVLFGLGPTKESCR